MLFESKEQHFSHPCGALALVSGVVAQQRQIIPELSVAENVLLGHQPRRGLFVNQKKLHKEAADWLARVGLDIDPWTRGRT
jgi:ABC-type sugar transport system ATPase subunit